MGVLKSSIMTYKPHQTRRKKRGQKGESLSSGFSERRRQQTERNRVQSEAEQGQPEKARVPINGARDADRGTWYEADVRGPRGFC